MGFERFHTRFNPTAMGNMATPKRIKKYHIRRNIYPTPCTANRKVSNT